VRAEVGPAEPARPAAPSMTDEPDTQLDEPETVDVDDYKNAGGELVVADGAHPEADAFRVLDKHDEDQVLQEMQGRVLDVTLYDFPGEGGARNVDLSYAGVREVVHLMNRTGKCKLRVTPGSLTVEEITEDGEDYYRATVWAEDLVTGGSFVGTAHVPKRMKLKPSTAKKWREKGRHVPDDSKVWDEFAYTKAVAKCQRNALKYFIPEPIRQTLIAQYLKDPARVRVIQAGAGAEEAIEQAPQLTDEKALELQQRARDLYAEIREHAPGGVAIGLPPAKFHQMLVQAWGSHSALESFIEALEDGLKRAKEKAAS
jgi:hypothetical protein